ncbi:YybH family protein [Spirosoma fluminis]
MKILLAVLATLISAFSFGQPKQVSSKTNIEQEITEIENQQVGLVQKNDFKALALWLDKTLTGNCTVIHGNGDLEDKTNLVKQTIALATNKDPNLLYETFRYVEQKVEVYGDAAIFSAKALSRSQPAAKAGRPLIESRLTHFFVKQDGGWRIAKMHITHLPIK